MSGLYGNPCVPEQSSSTSNRYEKASHRALAEMLGRISTPVTEANLHGNSLGNQLRRKDILPPFRMFYSLGSARTVCCWLRNAWGLLAPNDLLSVSAVRPPSTQSRMRSEAPGEAQG